MVHHNNDGHAFDFRDHDNPAGDLSGLFDGLRFGSGLEYDTKSQLNTHYISKKKKRKQAKRIRRCLDHLVNQGRAGDTKLRGATRSAKKP